MLIRGPLSCPSHHDLKPSQLPGMSAAVSPEEARDMDRLVPIQQFKKGTVLLKAGDVATASWFCIEGCVHYVLRRGRRLAHHGVLHRRPAGGLAVQPINQVPANHYLACVAADTAPWWCGATPPNGSSWQVPEPGRAAVG